MSNYLKMPKRAQVLALLELGWSYRRIEAETGVRRETVSGYDVARQANPAKTFPGSDPWPPPVSLDVPLDAGPNAATTFAGSESNPAKRSPARRHAGGSPQAFIAPRSPLAGEAFPLFASGERTVHTDGHVEVAGAFYPVPLALLGQRVGVRWDAHLVRVFDGDTLVMVHAGLQPACLRGPWRGRGLESSTSVCRSVRRSM